MKKLYKISFILLSVILSLQTVACTITSEDVEKIGSFVSTLNELEKTYNEATSSTDEKKDILSSVLSSAVKGIETNEEEEVADTVEYHFRNENLLKQHYDKHGVEMGFATKEEYEAAASAVVNNPNALHKQETEDLDDIYYIEETNEFVIVSTDGYIRTYFKPSAGIEYYNRQ